MAFTVPTFPIMCKVYSGPWLTKAFRFEVECNLALGRRVQQQFQDYDVPEVQASSLQMGLLLPALTDLHDNYMNEENDVIEVPSDSGRWYGLECFDDVAKGFGNEYRIAILSKIGEAVDNVRYAGCVWPNPVP